MIAENPPLVDDGFKTHVRQFSATIERANEQYNRDLAVSLQLTVYLEN